MGIFAVVSILLAATDGGSNLILLFAGAGGLTGLAALATVFITHRANSKKALVDDKSVAITELEKAVPGMGDIIKEWQNIVHQLQADLIVARAEIADLRKQIEGKNNHD